MAERKKLSKGIYNWVFFTVVIVSLVFVNIIGSILYKRIDMTEDQRFSLAQGTIKFLSNEETFNNRLSIKIYLDGNLPAELKSFRNAIEDKLQEFKQHAGNRIEYQFIDPNVGSEGEKQALFESLYDRGKGIIPMDVVYMKDGAQNQLLLWPGAVVDYGGVTVNTIQFLPGTSAGKPYYLDDITEMIDNSVKNLEYILVSSMRRSIQQERPRVAFLQGHGELSFAETQRARALISPYYNIADITLNDSLAALDDIDGLVIARPRTRFSDKDLYLIDQFVMRGGRLMCFLDPLHIDEDTLNRKGATHTTRNTTGLENLLYDYGLKINDNYVIDANCAPKAVPYAKQSLIPWFFHVLATPTKHPIARNLEPVSLKYASEIQFIPNKNLLLTPILSSSTNSNVTGLAPLVTLSMPMSYGKNPQLATDPTDTLNQRCLAGLAEGRFESHFRTRIVEEYVNNPNARKYLAKSSAEGKVFVIGNGRFIRNTYDSMPARNGQGYMYRPTSFNDLRMDRELAEVNIPVYFGNQEFFQNMMDYLMGDNSVLDVRSRQIDVHAMDKDKVTNDGTFYKIINVLLPILLILLFALLMNYIRKRKYTQH
jgi:ABC-2 type transport system permease protein